MVRLEVPSIFNFYIIYTFYLLFVLSEFSSLRVASLANDISDRTARGAPSTNPYRKWPHATVYYKIDKKLASVKGLLKKAMAEVEKVSCVRYVPRTNQVDYVTFQHNDTGCWEPFGRQGGAQKIMINIPACGNMGFFLHASMQVLGFYHEHQRYDRDSHINVNFENIAPESFWVFQKLDPTTHKYNSPYDVDSIMHYGSFQFSKNGQPTILTKTGGLILSWVEKAKLSPLDIVAINDFYDCKHNSNQHL